MATIKISKTSVAPRKKGNTLVKSPYGDLDVSSMNPHTRMYLVHTTDAQWLLFDRITHTSVPPESMIQSSWHGYEDFELNTTRDILAKSHENIFGTKCDKKMSHTSLALVMFLYRCSKAQSYLPGSENALGKAPGGGVRKLSMDARSYAMLPLPEGAVFTPDGGLMGKDGKKITGKQGVACLKILKDTCGESLKCSELQLREAVTARAAEVTAKAESAWRFFQFYRPLFVAAGLCNYQK